MARDLLLAIAPVMAGALIAYLATRKPPKCAERCACNGSAR